MNHYEGNIEDALSKHDIEAVWEWLEHGGNPRHITEYGDSLLHIAALNDKTDATKLLLDVGVDPNNRNAEDLTPICYASKAETIIMLHEYGASLTVEDGSYGPPLHRAACGLSVEAVTTMVALGADIYAEPSDGGLPAIYNSFLSDNCKAILLAFISMGFSVDGIEGHPLLHYAYGSERLEAVELLLKLGADPTLKDENGRDFEAFKEMVKERRKAADSQSVEAGQKVNPLLEKLEKQLVETARLKEELND
ncbi:ankyrin repeat domain-containing protein [Marinifilum sp. JC120]|nr:ankyrin repeat domain-containing protein [Marinifilum sp. JC120]